MKGPGGSHDSIFALEQPLASSGFCGGCRGLRPDRNHSLRALNDK